MTTAGRSGALAAKVAGYIDTALLNGESIAHAPRPCAENTAKLDDCGRRPDATDRSDLDYTSPPPHRANKTDNSSRLQLSFLLGRGYAVAESQLHTGQEVDPLDAVLLRGDESTAARSTIMALYVLDDAPEWARVTDAFERASRTV